MLPVPAVVITSGPQAVIEKSSAPLPLGAGVGDDGRAVQTLALLLVICTIVVGPIVVSASPVQASFPLSTPPT